MQARLIATVLAGVFLMGAAAPDNDPYTWMEEIEGARALDWAKAENARSLPQLQNDARYAGLYADALKIATAKDRIPNVGFGGDGSLRDYWQDAEHVRGVWRTASLDSYRSGNPDWKPILDIDALSKTENANWVWKGADCLRPDERYCLVNLSNGGKDAVEIREFDTVTGKFVDGGFRLPEGKHRVDWLDKDTLLVATDWTKADVTTSGYPFIAKILKRGQKLADAKQVFTGTRDDGGYGVQSIVLHDAAGKVQAVVIQRPLDTFNAEYYLLVGDRPLRLDLPKKSSIQGYLDGRLLVSLEEGWDAKGMKEGDLVDFDLAAVKKTPGALTPSLVLRPTESQSVEDVGTTKTRLVITLLDNVKGQVLSFQRKGGAWTSTKLDLPKDSTIGIASASDVDDKLIVNVASFLTPNSQWLADAAGGKPVELRKLPDRFDASKFVVEQAWATSKDGTKVPYFVVHAKGLKLDGTNPTLLNAYGGFLVSQSPSYSGALGKLWLEKGGVFVVANIRGGGEFGPRWHNAGLKLKRMAVYDDFFAVSQDLIDRKITNPKKLGIMGGSNGGLLMGVALTKHPELYNAIVIQVPLFDMIGYDHIGAGASWIGEYGDPKVPEERAMLMTYSPYQNLKPGQPYPRVFIETSTKDDRVHPAHARKAAARLKEYGYDYLYYENIDGGHAAAANLNERATRQALEYTYLMQRLMD
ncbi:MAG: prolyl oligopeptidase family serine peptidase [Alphaproteobacteria bacterium]|nr:prolyl oligopeptidase family serine peptidase [Alphaproteobacteria bacterium]MBU1514026.1 prolyl oligopeptidase family serine peptidase [Alphaproteobacteria bacterium]MBU2093034.1 prolyl oligopeptidase family serine peptidase [Alphaproteobacteria bacterium]MBU2151763.1 prolyl oligopeptidase family serine peptidase [Alphaproteobacteria bacterium]MBU2309417.1 prolyl oligopeptidase family serine peptidase [Alphaproteobacteria bacterium]